MDTAYSVYFPDFCSELSRLRDGDLAGAEVKNDILLSMLYEIHSLAIVGSAKVSLVVDFCREVYLYPAPLSDLDYDLGQLNAFQASLNDSLESRRRSRLFSIWRSICNDTDWDPAAEEASFAVVVSTVVLLSLVYQYLTGNVDIGSSKAYSRSSLDFRDIYVAVVLFLGAYVWIKFREVAFKGVHPRKIVDKRGRITKVVYEPRFKPPRENGTVFHWIYLGQYATPAEASILYQIAAFYYNQGRDQGQGGSMDLGDGHWFSIPPMSEGERSLTGAEKRAWVKVQAMKVYEDFRNEKAEAALWQELEACEDPATPRPGVDPSAQASLLNSAEQQPPLLVSGAENLGMATAMQPMLDGQGLECASQTFGGMHEGFVTSSGHSLGFQEESAIPTSQLPPDTQSGMDMNNSNQLNLPQIVHNQQELISYLHQQLQERDAQISVLQNEKHIQQQQLEESRTHISQLLEAQHFVEQQPEVINQGVPSFEMEMQRSVLQQNHTCRLHGSALW